jgi:uncharacterized protein (DUF433 family)
MSVVKESRHIALDDRGVAWVEGADIKVIELVQEHLAYGWSADELHEQHPDLTLGQIHAALSFFYDHQQEFETQLRTADEEYTRLRSKLGVAEWLQGDNEIGVACDQFVKQPFQVVGPFEGPAEPDEFRLHRFLDDFGEFAAADDEPDLLGGGQADDLKVRTGHPKPARRDARVSFPWQGAPPPGARWQRRRRASSSSPPIAPGQSGEG